MNLLALLKNEEIKRISINQDIQKQIEEYIKDSIEKYIQKEKIEFEGQYRTEEDQVLFISEYKINFIIDKLVINFETLKEDDIVNIKCIIFFYDKNKIVFQLFDSRKIINPKKFSLIYDNNTFSKLDKKGITISNNIDALFDNNQLFFSSLTNASKIFDLSDYYREVTDLEIEKFKKSDIIVFSQDIDNNLFDSKMRKKLYLIQKNKVVETIKLNFEKVSSYAKSIGVDEYFKDDKIYFPNDKKKLKTLINFLNDDLYKSNISDLLYETNSKRKVK